MVRAPENDKELSQSAHANGMNVWTLNINSTSHINPWHGSGTTTTCFGAWSDVL
jgi:hypothetical protein